MVLSIDHHDGSQSAGPQTIDRIIGEFQVWGCITGFEIQHSFDVLSDQVGTPDMTGRT